MTRILQQLEPCWDCVKGRHGICTGGDIDTGWACSCPVAHDGNRRRPALGADGWFDAYDDAALADE